MIASQNMTTHAYVKDFLPLRHMFWLSQTAKFWKPLIRASKGKELGLEYHRMRLEIICPCEISSFLKSKVGRFNSNIIYNIEEEKT
jgi:hypothetical protein